MLWTPFAGTEDGRRIVKARGRTDLELFAKVFFGTKVDKAFSRFHLEELRKPKIPFRERPPMSGTRRARLVPRGNGKTTTCVRIDTVHDIVYEFEEYIILLAESALLARSRVREVAIELEQNKLLKEYFGELKGEDVWRVGAGEIETSNGVSILAKSRKSQVRGLLHPVTNARPTKVRADDFENSEEVHNPELREKDRRFWKEDVEAGGTTDGRTNFEQTGTPLHRECLIMSHKDNPGWDFKAYPAIEKWPERMDLWNRCRQVFAAAGASDQDDDDAGGKAASADSDAIATAWRYYQANRKKMDRGARVLWPEGEPLFALMVYLWTNGEAAFSKEKQLVPRDPGLATFEMESEEYPVRGALRHTLVGNALLIDQRDGKTRRVPLSDLRFIAFHDPAKADPKGRRGRKKVALGDYAAIPVMGIETLKSGGTVGHVVDCWIKREPPSRQIEQAFEICEHWKVETFILEDDTYALLRQDYKDEAAKRRKQHRFHQIPLRSLVQQTTNKDARISAMEPAVVNGWITFNRTLPMVYWNQMIDHPTGDHDDGPDGTENCWRRRGFKRGGLVTVSLH